MKQEIITYFQSFFRTYNTAQLLVDFTTMHVIDLNEAALNLYEIKNKKNVIGASFFKLCKCDESRTKEEISFLTEEIKKQDNYEYTVDIPINNEKTIATKICFCAGNMAEQKFFIVNIQDITKERRTLEIEKQRADIANEANILLEKEVFKHKQTKKELEKSQEISKSVFNSSIDTIISTNLDNIITEVSPSACYTFGYDMGELLGKSANDLFAQTEGFEATQQQLNEEGYYIGEIENVRKDGSTFTSFISCAAIQNNKGEQIGFMGISRDITDIKKAEQELIESEKKYKDLFVNLNDALVVIDDQSRIIEMNNAACELLEIENTVGINVIEFLYEEDKEYMLEQIAKLRKEKYLNNVEFRIITKKKRIKYVTLSSSAIYKDGKYVGSRDILRDITEKKKHEKIIEEQNLQLESIFENSSDIMMWILDEDYKLKSFNSKLASYIKTIFKKEIKIGDSFVDFILKYTAESGKEKVKSFYNKALLGEAQHSEGVMKNSDTGKSIWVETFLSPIKKEGNNTYEIACIGVDITAKKKDELELNKSLKEKEVLLKEVHHRVKNNLQVISSILNLQSSYVKDENTLTILRESQNRVKSMSFIHESLYRSDDFSEVNFSDYVKKLVNNVVHSFNISRTKVMLIYELGNIKLNLDQAIPCGLIINEILTNAMKYAYENISQPKLFIELKQERKIIKINIRDNGIGLPENFNIDEIDSLGLQLVQTLVEQVDGEIEIKNEKGTKFLITFEKVS